MASSLYLVQTKPIASFEHGKPRGLIFLKSALFICLQVLSCWALAQSKDVGESLENAIDGSSFLVRYFHREGAPPAFEADKSIYIIDLRLDIPLTKTGNWTLNGRVGTGPNSTDDTNTLAQANHPLFKSTINLRELYIEEHPSHFLDVQAGAIELLQPGVPRSALGDSAIGWVDGGRADFHFKNVIRNVDITVGHLGLYTDTSAISRFKSEGFKPNFLQMRLKVALGMKSALTLEQTQLSSEAFGRIMIETAISKLDKIIDQVVIEEMLGSGKSLQDAFAIGLKKRLNNTEILPTFVLKSKSLDPTLYKPFVPLDSNFAPDNQFLLIVNHYLNDHNRLQMRFYDFLTPPSHTASNRGINIDISYKYTFDPKLHSK